MSTKIRIQEPMTRESLMKIIKKNRGTEGWNLSGCNMAGINLTGLDLRGIVLSEWDEKQGGWSAANLSNANIQAVNFADAKLCGVDFNEATLEDADMPGANLAMANFACANLQHADLTNANVGGCDFTNANLRMAHLSQVDLRNAKSLSGVFLYQVILDQTRLRKDQLGGAIGDELTGKNPEEARDAYLALKQNFENIGDYNSSSWVYVKERQMEKLWTKQQAQEE